MGTLYNRGIQFEYYAYRDESSDLNRWWLTILARFVRIHTFEIDQAWNKLFEIVRSKINQAIISNDVRMIWFIVDQVNWTVHQGIADQLILTDLHII